MTDAERELLLAVARLVVADLARDGLSGTARMLDELIRRVETGYGTP